MKIVARDIPPRAAWALEQAGVHPLLARLFAARGITHRDELDDSLARLLAPQGLQGADPAARLLADAIAADKRICVVADYDCRRCHRLRRRGTRLTSARVLTPTVLVILCQTGSNWAMASPRPLPIWSPKPPKADQTIWLL